MKCCSAGKVVKSQMVCEEHASDQKPGSARKNYYFEEKQLKALEALFDQLDEQKAGRITPAKAVTALQQCNLKTDEENVYKLVKLVDDNNDGQVEKNEFLRLYLAMTLENNEFQNGMYLFVAADQNMDGTINASELKNCCEKLGLTDGEEGKVIQEKISQLGDGVITQKEYRAFFHDFDM